MGGMPSLSRKMTMLRYLDIRLYALVLCLILGLSAALSGFFLERVAVQNYEEELAAPVLFLRQCPMPGCSRRNTAQAWSSG